MKCTNCFHYRACSALDVEGHMMDKSPEFYPNGCENYVPKKWVKLMPINGIYGSFTSRCKPCYTITSDDIEKILTTQGTEFEKYVAKIIDTISKK